VHETFDALNFVSTDLSQPSYLLYAMANISFPMFPFTSIPSTLNCRNTLHLPWAGLLRFHRLFLTIGIRFGGGDLTAGCTPKKTLAALETVLRQSSHGEQGFGGESDLMLASLTLCAASRSSKRHRLVFDERAPRHVQIMSFESGLGGRCRSLVQRIPPLRAETVRWELPMVPLCLEGEGYSLSEVRCLSFGPWFEECWDALASMQRLDELNMGLGFNDPLCDARWPPNLHKLILGTKFNQPVHGAIWPPLLQRLEFGRGFRQTLDGAVWPDSLREISLGEGFNHCIDRVQWPKQMSSLSFGKFFNVPIDGVEWPESLEELAFDMFFNQPIAWDTLPASLQGLSFGEHFDQAIDGVTRLTSLRRFTVGSNFSQVNAQACGWPMTLKQLTFGGWFTKRIDIFTWPPCLEVLIFGDEFNSKLAGTSWPVTLRRISFGDMYNESLVGVSLPLRIEEISFGTAFRKDIDGVDWPASLTKLTFGYWFSKPLVGLGHSITELTLGGEFNLDIAHVVWPTSLRVLRFGYKFNRPIPSSFPSNLRELRFGERFRGPISDDTVWRSLERLTLSSTQNTPFSVLTHWCPRLMELTILSDRVWPAEASLRHVTTWPHTLRKLTLLRTWEVDARFIPGGVEVVYL